MDFLRVLITAPVSIIVLFLMTKLIGNKQMSNLSLFDYINGITIGSIAAEMATSEYEDFWGCFIAIIIYSLVVILLAYLSQKSVALRRFFTGKSILLFDRGKFYKKNFSTAKIDMNEFLTAIRNQGYFCLDDIESVFLEQNGSVSVLPKDAKRPATPDDIKVRVHQTRAETVIILDGKLLEDNLKYTGNNLDWLKKQLNLHHMHTSEVYLAVCDGDNNLKIYGSSDEKMKNDIFE